MAEDKEIKGMMAGILRELQKGKGTSSSYERVSSEAAAKAREGRGLIGGFIAGERAKIDVAKEYAIATKGTTGRRQAFFEGLLGRDLGDLFKNLGLEKMESPERIKEAKEKFQSARKEKREREKATKTSVDKLSKSLTLILNKIIETQNLIKNIQQNIAKPPSSSKYVFDPRMGSTGRFRDVTTNKLVSSKIALESGGLAPELSPTDALTAAIGADETPLVKLREFLEFKFKDFDAQKLNKQLSSIDGKLDMILLAVGASTVTDMLDDVDVLDRDKKTKPDKPKKPGKPDVPKKGKLGRIGQVLSRAGKGVSTVARTVATSVAGTAAVAAGGALAITGGGLYALDRGLTKAGEEAKAKMDVLEFKYGLKTLKNERGFTSGYEVQGKKYGLNDLPQEYKDLIDAYGPGDKRSFSARSALKKIQENPEKYKALEISNVEPTTASETSLLESPEGAAVKPQTVSVPAPSTLPVESPEGAAIGAVPAAATVVAPPSPTPPPTEEKKSFGAIASGAISAAYSGIKKFLGFESPTDEDLSKYVRLKDSSVNLDGLNDQMKSRLAGLAKDYYDQTGQKIQINSGYRSPEEQAKLFAKYGAPRAAPPGRSRHESGLAVDINSSDANKAIELGLMSKYGFTRPVRGETWHIEPIETAKRGGTPDNPYKPGDPIVAANDGKEVNPESGTKPSGAVIADRLPDSGVAPAAGLGPAGQPRGEGMEIGDRLADSGIAPASPGLGPAGQPRGEGMKIADRLPDSGVAPAGGLGPAGQPRGEGMKIADTGTNQLATRGATAPGLVTKPATTPGLITPVERSMGKQVAEGSAALESSKMVAQVTPPAPVIINNQSNNQQPIQPPKTPIAKASSRSSDNSFNRALAKDFSHPTAFTSVGVI